MSRSTAQVVTVTVTAPLAQFLSLIGATVKSEAQQLGVTIAGTNQTVTLRPVD